MIRLNRELSADVMAMLHADHVAREYRAASAAVASLEAVLATAKGRFREHYTRKLDVARARLLEVDR